MFIAWVIASCSQTQRHKIYGAIRGVDWNVPGAEEEFWSLADAFMAQHPVPLKPVCRSVPVNRGWFDDGPANAEIPE